MIDLKKTKETVKNWPINHFSNNLFNSLILKFSTRLVFLFLVNPLTKRILGFLDFQFPQFHKFLNFFNFARFSHGFSQSAISKQSFSTNFLLKKRKNQNSKFQFQISKLFFLFFYKTIFRNKFVDIRCMNIYFANAAATSSKFRIYAMYSRCSLSREDPFHNEGPLDE